MWKFLQHIYQKGKKEMISKKLYSNTAFRKLYEKVYISRHRIGCFIKAELNPILKHFGIGFCEWCNLIIRKKNGQPYRCPECQDRLNEYREEDARQEFLDEMISEQEQKMEAYD